MFMKKLLKAAIAATLFAYSVTNAVFANDEPEEDKFVPLSEMRPLEKAEGFKNRHAFQYGLSASNTYINKKENWVEPDKSVFIKDQRKGLFIGNYRPYVRYTFNEQHTFNLRGRFEYRNNPSIPNEDRGKNGQVVSNGGYSIEMFNAELDFDKHKVTAGRAFYRMGRGLLFANFADGAEYTGNFRFLQVKLLAAYSGEYAGCTISIAGCRTNSDAPIKSAATFDIVPGRSIDAVVPAMGRRYFVGAEIQSAQVYGSNAYLLGLYSRDINRDAATAKDIAGKIYAFDPYYFGAGLQGYIGTSRIRYLAEGIVQKGNTYNANNVQVPVDAWAFTADLNFTAVILQIIKPVFSLQYGYASGRDSNKPEPGSAAQAGTSRVDNNFYAFGVYSAGLALQPRLNNLHVARAGIQFKPLYHFYWGRNLMTSFKYSIYQKGNVEYGISDTDASLASRDVGRGLDVQVVYDLRSDLKLFYAYGYFSPGSAYRAADAKYIHTHIVSLNFLF
jgi:hypothetical protein